MTTTVRHEVRHAISVERALQQSYRKMAQGTRNPKMQALLHDLLLMEELNEVLLRSLSQNLES